MADPRSQDGNVAWTDVVRFVRQLSHDLRNHLNAIELQSVYIGEITSDSEVKTEIQRLREMIAQASTELQRLSAQLAEVNPVLIPYGAADFLNDLKQKVANDFEDFGAKTTWDLEMGDAELKIDPQLLLQAFLELFRNAFQRRSNGAPPAAKARVENDQLLFTLHEPKPHHFDLTTDNWGREPLRHLSQGHYGLGLNRARAIVEGHGGKLSAHYDSTASVLLSTISLPLLKERHRP
jgi:K+-sensing histidine kinase KdpD